MIGALAVVVFLQCPDGTPPPCASRAPRAANRAPVVAPDPNRIAVLPFRVTTADTLLGEGVAELLSAEFTGENSPRAVHMGSVIRAWRQAGGGPRAPLPQADAIRAARGVGAGLVVDGSIVGIGQRLTVSANVVSVLDGRARRATPVSGSADSLDVLLRRFTTNLLAAAGGESRATERGTLTESAPAMRAYLEGLSAWRRYRVPAAAAAWERAFREDSTFARAAFMRYVSSGWGQPAGPQWARATWALRERLSPPDRLLLTAYLGAAYPAQRTPAQILADRERAARELPESPEAQFVLADWLFHYGASAGVTDRLARSVAGFARSLALDTQETVLGHLTEAGALAGDTALLRSLQPALDQAGPTMWAPSWLAAGIAGDAAWTERLRRRPPNGNSFAVVLAMITAMPDPLILEELNLLEQAGAGQQVDQLRYLFALYRGRPAQAEQVAVRMRDAGAEAIRIFTALYGDGDTAEAGRAAERIAAARSTRGDHVCALGLWRIEHGQAPDVNDSLVRRSGQPQCAGLLALGRARIAGAPDVELLNAADSLLRFSAAASAATAGFENVVVSRAWEARGDLRRALAAIRMRTHAVSVSWAEATAARVEGRLAAQLGDTTAAVAAYRRYLLLRRDPEPLLVPQRDSVVAELRRLERR